MSPRPSSVNAAPDVVIIGDGIAGFTVALALARRGISSRVLGTPRTGQASRAAAGLLAPSLGAAPPDVRGFLNAARAFYPAFLDYLLTLSSHHVALGPYGILELARTDADFAALQTNAPPHALPLDRRVILEMEPALASVAGALLHPGDTAIDTLKLMAALEDAVAHEPHISRLPADITHLEFSADSAVAINRDGTRHTAPTLVLAAGAWSVQLAGLPRAIPVEPLRGQMLAFDAAPLKHVVTTPNGYLVPRGRHTLVGSTAEHAGFDASTSVDAVESLAHGAIATVPSLAHAPRLDGWAGLRPVTPDMQPILGRDPHQPRLVYATGYSRNGILVAPLAGECVAAIIANDTLPQPIARFSITRFSTSNKH